MFMICSFAVFCRLSQRQSEMSCRSKKFRGIEAFAYLQENS